MDKFAKKEKKTGLDTFGDCRNKACGGGKRERHFPKILKSCPAKQKKELNFNV